MLVIQYSSFLCVIALLTMKISGVESRPTGKPRTFADRKCITIISEAHFPSSDLLQFVEIEQRCQSPKMGPKSNKALRNFKLAIVAADPLQVVFLSDFDHTGFNFRDEEKFFVVGNKPPYTLSIENIQISNKELKFPFEQNQNYGMFLLKQDQISLRKIKLPKDLATNKLKPLDVTSEIQQLFVDSTVDFWGINVDPSANSSENSFASLLPMHARTPYEALRTGGAQSVSFCGNSFGPFKSTGLLHTKPTPGDYNNCQSTETATNSQQAHLNARAIQMTSLATKSRYDSLQGFKTPQVVPNNDFVQKQTRAITRPAQLSIFRSRKFTAVSDDVIAICSSDFPDKGRLLERPFIKSWLNIKRENSSCIYSCQACQLFFDMGFRVDMNKPHRRHLITSTGYIAEGKGDNHKALVTHNDHKVHQLAIIFLHEFKRVTSEEDFLQAVNDYEESEYKLYLPTINMVRLVYAEILTETPFFSHKVFVETIKRMQSNLGHRHGNSDGALVVSKSISHAFHKILLQYLVKHQLPFVLIADASTDRSNTALLACMIQTIVEGKPKTFFYRLIYLKHGENAQQLFQALEAKLKEDELIVPGFLDYFKSKLIGTSTDNASVMTAKGNSFYSKLKTYVGRSIYCSACSAHRLQLATKHAVNPKKEKRLKYFERFETTCNKVFTFYMSRGSKRWEHFREISDQVELNVKRFKPFYQVRWASSHYHVVSTMVNNYEAVLIDSVATILEANQIDSSKTLPSYEMFQTVNEKNFPSYLHEYMDFLQIFKDLSLKFEESSSNMLGKYEILTESIEKLKRLKESPGPQLLRYLKSCRCSLCSLGECTIELYDACEDVVCGGYQHDSANATDAEPLSNARSLLYENFLSELRAYFPLDEMKSLEIFNLQKIVTMDDARKKEFIDSSLGVLCPFLHMNESYCLDFSNSYYNFLEHSSVCMGEVDDFCSWSYILTAARFDVPFIVKDTVQSLMVIPFTSADAERVFSFMEKIKSNARTRLTPSNLQHLIRVKFNGPKEISKFDAYYYTRKFLKHHSRTDENVASVFKTFSKLDADSILF